MPLTPGGITKVESGQNLKYTTVNEAFVWLNLMAGGTILDRDLTAPPGSPSDGDLYLVKATATGDWAGHDGELALYLNGWKFIDPTSVDADGWTFWLADEDFQIGYADLTWFWVRGKWPGSEIWTGRYTEDATPKKIMTKVLTVPSSGVLSNAADVSITHSITSVNLDSHLAAFGTIRNSNTSPTEGAPFGPGGSVVQHNRILGVRFDATYLILRPNWDASGWYVNFAKIRIEYTDG